MSADPESKINSSTRYRWKTRRRIVVAYAVLYAIISLAFVFYIPETRIKLLDAFYGSFSITIVGVIGSYFGFATWDDKKSVD
jgi:uncharacterized BrkB/YihY/UPF0761 family membrane protein